MIKLFHITYVILYLIFGLSNQVFADGIDTKELNNKKIEGIIVGKAIYDGDIKLEELAREINA